MRILHTDTHLAVLGLTVCIGCAVVGPPNPARVYLIGGQAVQVKVACHAAFDHRESRPTQPLRHSKCIPSQNEWL